MFCRGLIRPGFYGVCVIGYQELNALKSLPSVLICAFKSVKLNIEGTMSAAGILLIFCQNCANLQLIAQVIFIRKMLLRHQEEDYKCILKGRVNNI